MKIIFKSCIFIILLISILTEKTLGQDYIKVPDTVITRGGTHLIPVYGDFIINTGEQLQLTFSFNAMILDIKKIIGGDDFALKSAEVPVNVNLSEPENSYFTFTSDNISISNNEILFLIALEGLVFRDSISILNPSNLRINGIVQNNIELLQTNITVSGITLIDRETEFLGTPFPNPVRFEVDMDFGIMQETKIKFELFDYSGRSITIIPDEKEYFNYFIFNQDSELIEDVQNYTFPKGIYKLRLHPKINLLKAGPYYIVMRTTNNIYRTNFIFIK